MSEWCAFIEMPTDTRTKRWEVETIDGGIYLGEIKWFSRWRRYAFFPDNRTVFEQDCLRQIADWVEARTKEHRPRRVKADG